MSIFIIFYHLNSSIYQIVCVLVTQLCDPVDGSPPGSFAHGLCQARILEWAAIPFSRGSSQARNQTWVSGIAGGFLTVWATKEAQIGYIYYKVEAF